MLRALIDEMGLDKEWIDILLHALEVGVTVEEIIEFFNQEFRP
ncbi:DNA-binding anti-repressor SinI [Bacillus sp. SA1-12]|nr:DNA-binding anti-repressor SinI [Bacillus sp. SA1-12]